MALIIDIKCVPKSGRQTCVLDAAGCLKCFLKQAPEGGKANAELVAMLAKALRITKDAITIVLGATSRTKRISIDANLTFDDLCDALGVERQLKL